MAVYPSLKARQLLRVLAKLGYTIVSQEGSHRKLAAEGRPPILFSYHDGVTVPPGAVRKMLERDAGLTETEALRALGA